MTHILQLMARQSTATLGSLARAWLTVMAALWLPIGYAYITLGVGTDRFLMAIFGGGLISGMLSVPIMAAIVVIHIARKW